jgi:hypothetical protein
MLTLQGSWAFEFVYVANQDATNFIYILGLLGISFMLLIKLQKLFIHPWASRHCVFVVD